jgi:Tol biopolymer transport system component
VLRRTLLILTPALAIACSDGGGGGTGPDNSAPGIHAVSGANVADTVSTTLAQPLVVRIIGPDRKPVSDAIVRFNPTILVSGKGAAATTMVSPTTTGGFFSLLATDTTDASGQASARVQLGGTAGTAGVIVTVPSLSYIDTLTFTVKPGNATRLVMQPQDTAVYVGRSFSLRGTAFDRFGNARTDRVTYTLTNGHASISGTTLAGRSIGRVRLTARVGSLSDTAGVSVVPRGTIAAYSMVMLTGQSASIYTLDLDGSNLRKVVQSEIGPGYNVEAPPVWSTDGKTIFYHDGRVDARFLKAVDVATGTSRRLATAGNQLQDEAWPARSPDGQWLYFNGSKYADAVLFRIRTDGTGREQVSPAAPRQFRPSLSRDGTRVAGVNDLGISRPGPIEMMTLSTKTMQQLFVFGIAPAWSPNDDRIAFVTGAGEIRVVNADGTGLRTVVPGPGYSDRVDWSPDAKYLIAVHNSRRLVVIDVATGEEMPVYIKAGDQFLMSPAWKR